MSEVSDASGKGQGRRTLTIVAVAIAALAVFVVALLFFSRQSQPGGPAVAGVSTQHEGPFGRYAKGSLARLQTWAQPQAQAASTFKDAAGKPLNLAAFRGKVVVVNIWATWCGPCRTEMPTLATLQKRYVGSDLVVVPVSVDKPDYFADAKSFIGVQEPLPLFTDPSWALATALKLKALPATVIYDRQGREVARFAGEAKWDTPESYALMDALLKS